MMQTKWTIGSSIAVALFTIPFVLVIAIEPEWLGRFSGVWWFYGVMTFVVFWGALDSRIELLYPESPLYKKYGRPRVSLVARVVVFGFGLFLLYFNVLPLVRDSIYLTGHRGPVVAMGQITRTHAWYWNLGGIITQELVLKNRVSEEERTFYIHFHYPPLRTGEETYRFFYVPNTMTVLEIHGAESSLAI